MDDTKAVQLADVVKAAEALTRQNMPVNVSAVRRMLGRGSHPAVLKLLKLVVEPENQRVSKIEAQDRLIAKLLSENATVNAGVPGQLVELLDEIRVMQGHLDATFDRAFRILSLVQTVILENISTIDELSGAQETIRRELAELRYILNHRVNRQDSC